MLYSTLDLLTFPSLTNVPLVGENPRFWLVTGTQGLLSKEAGLVGKLDQEEVVKMSTLSMLRQNGQLDMMGNPRGFVDGAFVIGAGVIGAGLNGAGVSGTGVSETGDGETGDGGMAGRIVLSMETDDPFDDFDDDDFDDDFDDEFDDDFEEDWDDDLTEDQKFPDNFDSDKK
jgi:hypothetical protein